MQKIVFTAVTLLVTMIAFYKANSQDFSNKGKDFWVGYGNHVRMYSTLGGQESMSLYITSDVSTSGTVAISSIGFNQNFTVTANQITTVDIPRAARLDSNGIFNHGIHVTALRPIVVYSHIYAQNVSGATVCLPTNTLGQDYYSVNYTQLSNETPSYSYFFVVATEDNTTVEISPTENTLGGWLAGSVNNVVLNKGQIYQVLANTDLTGSTIRSIAGAGGCKRIAVFSGSGKVFIRSGMCLLSSADNLYQQVYPTSTWGKKYITVPSLGRPHNFYRVLKSNPAANVFLNGILIPAVSFVNNLFYEFDNNTTNLIESDQPIMVAQYFTTQGCNTNPAPYDPEMIFINPVEQTINNVTLNSTPNYLITQHTLNVAVKNTGTAISSMMLDGTSVSSFFSPLPQDFSYSYASIPVTAGTHNLVSDSGFNAIAYGFGDAESYGYSAGTNLKDLYQFISIQNQFATVNFPAGCKNSPFYLYMTFPYQPLQISWEFSGLFPDVTINSPVFDSTWIVNGRQLYRYKLPTSYTINAVGSYPIKVIAQNPTGNGCTGEQEIDYDLQVFDPPVAAFSFINNSCVTDTVFFSDNSNSGGRPVVKWNWDFADGSIDSTRNTKHRYTAAGTYQVKHSLITDVGCLSDTAKQTIVLNDPPVAAFNTSTPGCVGKQIIFTDASLPNSGNTLVKWYWDFGDGTPQVIASVNTPQSHIYNATGAFTASLIVETNTGCRSFVSTKSVTIHPTPVVSFGLPNVCLPAGTAQFSDQSTISDGSQNLFTYQWNFGDGSTSVQQNPLHTYASAGPFNVTLVVTSNNGCADDSVRIMNTIYAQPQAQFSTNKNEACLGETFNFTDQSAAPNSSVTQWQWDFNDGTTSTQQHPSKTYANPGTYSVILNVTSAIGCPSSTMTKTLVVNPLPAAGFNVSVPNCVTRDITFTDGSVANAGNLIKWTWNYDDGTTAVLNNNSPLTHNYSVARTYSVGLQVETDKGCISTLLTKPVVVSPLPVPGFVLPENCLNDPFSQFTDTTKIADGTESQFSYLWNFGDPNANAGNPNISTIKNPQHKYTATGVYNVTVNVTSNNGCTTMLTQPFTINGTAPQSAFTVLNGNTQCSNTDISVINNSTVDFGNIVKLEVYWDYANDPTSKFTDNDPVPGKAYKFRYPEFATPATKNVTIRVVAYSGDNCLNTTTQVITLLSTPVIQFDAVNAICADVPAFQITQAREINNISGLGIFTGSGASPTGLFNPALAGAGTHIIRYTFTSSNSCVNYKEQPIQVYPVPVANAGPDRVMLEGGNITLIGSGTGTGISYLWTPNIALDNNTIANPKVSTASDIFYTLTVTNVNGCKDSDDVFVKLLKVPVIPNAFSPNGDGINDKWEIDYLESYPGCTVAIYNRYGQIIYRSTGYDKPWDGNYKNKSVPAGTYYYIVDPKNGRQRNGRLCGCFEIKSSPILSKFTFIQFACGYGL